MKILIISYSERDGGWDQGLVSAHSFSRRLHRPGLDQAEKGARNQVSPEIAKSLSAGATLAALPRPLAAELEVEQLGPELLPMWAVGIVCRDFMLAPRFSCRNLCII